MKLIDTQLVLLSGASQREDRGIEPPANLKGGAAQKLVRKLFTEGLIDEVRAVGSLPVWRRDHDNRPLALRITKRGLAAIQVDAGGAQPEANEQGDTEQRTRLIVEARPSRSALAKAARPDRTQQSCQSADEIAPLPKADRSVDRVRRPARRPRTHRTLTDHPS